MDGLKPRPEGLISKVIAGTVSGATVGAVVGAIEATWQDAPAVLKNQAWPALMKTGRVMQRYTVTFGLIGLAYTGVDAIAENMRGTKDIWNGALGGAAAGAIIGARVGRVNAAVGGAAGLAALSAAMDASGGNIRGTGFDDGATPPPVMYPYKAKQ